MTRFLCVLLCALIAISALQPISARKNYGGGGSRHSYPKSGGLSGGSSNSNHGYPSSSGLSGSHSYPASGGLSGNHNYPSSGGMSGGSHGYPSSGNNHGYPSSGNNHGYPSSGSNNGYPAGSSNNHHSGSHGYPAGKGLSGNTNSGGSVTTNIHHHYHYSPPQQISYASHGGHPASYPVYRGSPPSYVYQYKDSGSKYGTLIAGLALLNLGTLAAGTAYAVSHSHSNSNNNYNSYNRQPGEVCKFGLKRDNGDYEETKIDCQLISSFIYEEQAKAQTPQAGATNTTITTTTVTNTTVFNNTGAAQPTMNATAPVANPVFALLPNGTYVPLNITLTSNDTSTSTAPQENATAANAGSMTSSSSVTTTTTVQNALDVKGAPVTVTPQMVCYVIRNSPSSNMKRSVPCGLLQTYADKSLQRNSANRTVPFYTLLAVICSIMISF